ncbi:MAG: hypothetical protein ABI480_14905 [Chitinophagaceae bacterium]
MQNGLFLHPFTMMRIILSFLFLIISIEALSQDTIRGQVLSQIDGKPVHQFRLNVGKKNDVITDSSGIFLIISKKKKIKVSYLFATGQIIDTLLSANIPEQIIKLYTTNTWDSLQALYDIKHRVAWMFCCTGFAPQMPPPGRKYNDGFILKYFVMGDCPPAPMEKLLQYNRVVEAYLLEKYRTLGWEEIK